MAAQLSLFKGRRQRGVKSPTAKEFDTHCMLADILRRWQTPGWRWSHFPAGEWRHPVTAMRLKRMGMQVGWPDFILLSPGVPDDKYTDGLVVDLAGVGRAHFLELKRKGKQLSDFQRSFQGFCISNGYPYFWCDNFRDAVDQLKLWGAVRAKVSA
jgi:hypothetical protein